MSISWITSPGMIESTIGQLSGYKEIIQHSPFYFYKFSGMGICLITLVGKDDYKIIAYYTPSIRHSDTGILNNLKKHQEELPFSSAIYDYDNNVILSQDGVLNTKVFTKFTLFSGLGSYIIYSLNEKKFYKTLNHQNIIVNVFAYQQSEHLIKPKVLSTKAGYDFYLRLLEEYHILTRTDAYIDTNKDCAIGSPKYKDSQLKMLRSLFNRRNEKRVEEDRIPTLTEILALETFDLELDFTVDMKNLNELGIYSGALLDGEFVFVTKIPELVNLATEEITRTLGDITLSIVPESYSKGE